jgi:hypothetical protein
MSEILSDDALSELLASSGAHGEYDEALTKFIDSGVKGIKVSLTEGPFAGKKETTVRSGFVNAVNRRGSTKADGSYKMPPLPEGVRVAVIAKNDNVYVVRRDLVQPTPTANATATDGAAAEGATTEQPAGATA